MKEKDDMRNNRVFRFAALIVGALLVSGAASDLAFSLARQDPRQYLGTAGYFAVSLPLVLGILLSVFLYMYGRSLDSDILHIDAKSLLFSGTKLLGLYLFVRGVPVVLSSISSAIVFAGKEEFGLDWAYTLTFGATNIVFGFLLMVKTDRLWSAVGSLSGGPPDAKGS